MQNHQDFCSLKGNPITDEELGLRIASEAPDGTAHPLFLEIYGRLSVMVERFIAARIDRSHVDDVHQLTWAKAWRNAKQFTEGTTYRAWLLTIARNTITDEFRKRSRRPVVALSNDGADLLDSSAAVDAAMIDEEQLFALKGCLQQLEKKAIALVRGRMGGISYQDLCQTLNLSESAAHKLFFNSKSRLQDCLESKIA